MGHKIPGILKPQTTGCGIVMGSCLAAAGSELNCDRYSQWVLHSRAHTFVLWTWNSEGVPGSLETPLKYATDYRAFNITLCCLHASVCACAFRENYGAIASCSNWPTTFSDTDAYTCHTNALVTPPMGHAIFCARGLPAYTCPSTWSTVVTTPLAWFQVQETLVGTIKKHILHSARRQQIKCPCVQHAHNPTCTICVQRDCFWGLLYGPITYHIDKWV